MIMKKIYRNILLATFAITLMGCTERHDEVNLQPKVPHTFSAVIEDGDVTKTTLGDYPEEGNTTSRSVMWEYMDSIVVSCSHWYSTDLFVNKNECTSGIAVFEGNTSPDDRHFALYPYNTDIEYYTYADQHEYLFNLPLVQKYSTNSIGRKSFPMVGRKVSGEDRFYFKNLCGALVVQLTGTETVKSITFSGVDATGNPIVVSGHARVNLEYTEIPTMEMYPDNGNKYPTYDIVTLDCGEGVALDPATPTPFYIVLPPATYSSFQLMISTTSGKVMLKESDKPLTISRSRSAKAAALTYTETIPVNLSERGTSNSYIVSDSGIYSFDASVIGNGSAGIIPNAAFHTSDPSISPASVELLWEDISGIISGLAYNSDEKRISFMSHGVEGNALVAAKDANGTILWSWHIWCTDTPAEHIYINHQNQYFRVLDRNLGATRADRGTGGEDWMDAVGLHYQWGRKDPLINNCATIGYQLSIQESIEFATRLCSQHQWMYDINPRLWTDTTKTIYDPCPVGYKVSPNAIWSGFLHDGKINSQRENDINKSGSFHRGWDFYYDGANTAYYPTTEQGSYWGLNYSPSQEQAYYWSSTNSWDTPKGLYFRYTDSYNLDTHLEYNWGTGYPLSVRCVADEGYIDPTLPVVDTVFVSSITEYDALAQCSIVTPGSSEVISKGVVWSKTPNPTIELTSKTENNDNSSNFTSVVTGLESFTTYYIRAYATNSYGTAYGPEVEFSTTYSGDATDLSATESANSYIVNDVYPVYKLRAVKGNSSEELSDPFSGSVVWESYGTNESIRPGDLVDKVMYHDGYLYFKLDEAGKEGNALIAVKNTKGEILWSWHIWLTDTPSEHTYANGAAILMDRNLGATSATPGDVQALGLLYQWGRKDPFLGSSSTSESIVANSSIIWPETEYYTTHGNIEYVTSHPTTFIRALDYNENWDWLYDHDTTLWGEEKTIYDPCPVGWKVASMKDASNHWSNDNFLTLPARDDTNHGFLITLLSGEQAWYPLTGDRYVHGALNGVRGHNITWSSRSNETSGCSLGIWENGSINPHGHWEWKAKACSVRCQKIQ